MIRVAGLDEMPRGSPERARARMRRPEHRRAMNITGGAIMIPGRPFGAGGFNGNFASLFPPADVLLSVQSDRGFTVGAAMLPNGANVGTASIAASGAFSGTPVPIWVKATNSLGVGTGGTFNVYFDGLGVTAGMVGVTPTGGAGIALTGAGAGVTLTWAVGSTATGDTWKATLSAWADQSGNGNNFTAAATNRQPVATTGLQGNAGLLFDGVTNGLVSPLVLATPSVTPIRVIGVIRQITAVNTARIWSDNGGGADALIATTLGAAVGYNGIVGAPQTVPVGTWEASETYFSNSAADELRRGSNGSLLGALGNQNSILGFTIGFAYGGGSPPANCEFLQLMVLKGASAAAVPATWRAAVTAKYGAAVNV